MTVLFLILPLLSAVCYVALVRQFDVACKLSNGFYITLVAVTAYSIICFQPTTAINFTFLSLPQCHLNLLFALDKLSLSMLLLISLIGLAVNRYSAYYVYSDLNRSRFLFQLSLVTFSVIFLVLSANLLTAFIGWQLIGFHLYWLLNHYHYDENANRAAKKKFVINRIGDLSFLLAVIISLCYYSSTDFQNLFSSPSPIISIFKNDIPIRTIILSFVFVAVMTKSAQFPFHIWLPDTMQTPTPVSAIMHAGVINAGGYLLARLAPGLITAPNLLIFISCIGLITLLLGNLFSLYQPDVKKQLAYSTMSQMGYMVLQCGLGCFIGAVFHLIAHGFFKTWSFLNSGNQLIINYDSHKKGSIALYLFSLVITLIIFCLSLYCSNLFYQFFSDFPLLVTFLFITLYQLISNAIKQGMSIPITSIFIILLVGIFLGYIYLIFGYNDLFEDVFPVINTPLFSRFQYGTIVGVLVLYLLYLYIRYNKPSCCIFSCASYLVAHKLFIEEMYRCYLLEPIRHLGDIFYKFFVLRKWIVFLIFGLIIVCNIINYYSKNAYTVFLFAFDLVALMIFLLTANRAREIKHVLLFLALSQFTLALIAFQMMSVNATKIAYFQLINTALLSLLMIIILKKIKYGKKLTYKINNKLPWLAAYMTALLFCLIGLPFTSTFISEVVILKELMAIHPLLTIVVLLAIFLLSVSILHALQDYIFKGSAIEILSRQLSKLDHLLFFGIIFFNFLNGLYPSYILKFL